MSATKEFKVDAAAVQSEKQVALDALFSSEKARTYRKFLDKKVPEELLKQIYDTLKWGPTAFNISPLRVVYVQSAEAKEKLKAVAMEGNHPSISSAPVTAILAFDEDFVESLPALSPNFDAASLYKANPSWIPGAARLNGNLQMGYFIAVARALGLDCGPMSGFDNAALDAAFFKGTNVKSLVLVNLGYADPEGPLYPRCPRLAAEEAVTFL